MNFWNGSIQDNSAEVEEVENFDESEEFEE